MLSAKKIVKQKVLEILQRAMTDHLYLKKGHILYAGKMIYVRDGFVSQSIFADPRITGSTEGKRRLRELRADPELQEKYIFEMRHKGKHWEYRILPRRASNECATNGCNVCIPGSSQCRMKYPEV